MGETQREEDRDVDQGGWDRGKKMEKVKKQSQGPLREETEEWGESNEGTKRRAMEQRNTHVWGLRDTQRDFVCLSYIIKFIIFKYTIQCFLLYK